MVATRPAGVCPPGSSGRASGSAPACSRPGWFATERGEELAIGDQQIFGHAVSWIHPAQVTHRFRAHEVVRRELAGEEMDLDAGGLVAHHGEHLADARVDAQLLADLARERPRRALAGLD